ncbi:MAG: CoA transferase [Deltaproteobacteria bacterium]|nr:CoA transferase [Deltaproteobacteria bacterium]
MLALQGIRVLDLSRLLPGPFCTQLLRDLGAEVIKVEDPLGGDYVRHTPPLLEDGNSVFFHTLNRGKKSITLDLKSELDRARFLKLVRTADVVVEGFRPGVLDKLGVGPARLLEENPRVVVCSISGYGQTGPLARRAGHDVNYLAHGGALALMAEPTLLPVQVADLAGGALPAAFSICAALVGRATTGKGSLLDVSMTHQAHGLLAMTLSRASVPGEPPLGGGRDLLVGGVPCYGVYPTADGHLSVGSIEPKFWQGLCAALELPELADRSLDSGAAGDEVRGILAARLRTRTTAEWAAIFGVLDVCVEPLRAPEQVLADPSFARVDVVIGGVRVPLPVPASAFGAPPVAERGPALGEHTDELLGALG